MADVPNGDAWEADPLKLEGRPSMPCDLCEVFRIGAGEGRPKHASMARWSPPFGPVHRRDGNFDIRSMHMEKIAARKVEFEFHVGPPEGNDGSLAGQLSRALCIEALHVANGVIMDELHGCPHSSADKCGVDELCSIASELCTTYPYPQFPTGVALLLPSSRMASLLSSPGAHVAVGGFPGMPRVFVNGVEAIAYDPGGDGAPLTYILPRRGSVGLAISKVAIHAPGDGDRRHVTAHFYVGAHSLAGPLATATF